jgi:hypothetical protein
MEKEAERVYGLHTHITLRCVRALWKLLAQKECTDESVGEFIFLSPTLPFRSRRDLYILVTHVLRKGIIRKYVCGGDYICEGRASFVSRWVIQITRPLSFRSLFVLEIDMHLMVLDDFFQPSSSLYKQRAGWMTICASAATPVMRKWHANESWKLLTFYPSISSVLTLAAFTSAGSRTRALWDNAKRACEWVGYF